MNKKMISVVLLSCVMSAVMSRGNETPPIVPWAKSIHIKSQTMILDSGSRVVIENERLKPLATIVSNEIYLASSIRIPTEAGKSKSGDIILKINNSIPGEAYCLEVTDRAIISGGCYRAVAWGTVTLLQAIRKKEKMITLPCMHIEDEPFSSYRGLSMDVARKWHSIETIKQIICLCRFYKIKYLQLHLTDDQAFTFPSTKYPELTTKNYHGGPSYTLAELNTIVKFADERGVTIVPELEVPGHGATMNRTMPELFKIKGTKPYEHHASINFANEKVIQALETIVSEMCDVFKSSPYFHIGGDEADLTYADQNPYFKAAFSKFGLKKKGQWQLYRHFLIRMDEIVKKHGKQTIVWEGFHPDPKSQFQIPKDIIVMEYECPFYPPRQLLKDGFTVINAAWTPLYVVNKHKWSGKKIYNWNLYLFGQYSTNYASTIWHKVEPNHLIIGGQMCSWEQPEAIEFSSLREGLPAMSERIWNPNSGRPYADFHKRWQSADALLEKLCQTVTFKTSGLVKSDKGHFDANIFNDTLTITMQTKAPNTEVHYTLDGKVPTSDSNLYTSPVKIHQTSLVRAAAFDLHNRRQGYQTGIIYYYEKKVVPNLATDKPVIVSGGTQQPQKPEFAVDGRIDNPHDSWWASPWPQWLQIDLEKIYPVNKIVVYPYWDGARYYQYTVEISEDGLNWFKVVDRSSNTLPAKPEGDSSDFTTRNARYVRVNMLKNSANEGVHLVEVQVFEAKP